MNNTARYRSAIAGFLLLLLCIVCPLSAQPLSVAGDSPQEQRLFAAWQEHHTLPADITSAVLIAEGATDSAGIATRQARIQSVYSDIDSYIADRDNDYERARAVFNRLHNTVLKTYRDNASFRTTLDSGVYNCASAIALFYGAARHAQLPVSLYATPAHVFATLDIPNRTIRIEMTRSNGFDFGNNLPEIIEHLIDYHYVSREDVQERGEEEIFRSFFVESNRLGEAEFLAITYNNIGVQYWLARRYRETAQAFEKAIILHPESRKYRDAYQAALYLVLQQYETGRNFDDIEYLLKRSARLMHNDTLFIYYLLGAAGSVVAHYSNDESGLYRSRAFLDTLAHTVPHDSTVDAMIGRQQYIVNYNLAVYDFNRGDYEGAYRSTDALLAADTGEATQNLHAKSASYFALALAEREHAADAYALLDSLIPLYYRHPVFRDTYRKVTIDYVLQSGLIRRQGATYTDLMKARDLLLNVYDVDSTNIYLRGIIAAVHHELGMIELRAMHYTAAAEILRIGLYYDPDNEFIRESLRLVEEQIPSAPPPVNGLRPPAVQHEK